MTDYITIRGKKIEIARYGPDPPAAPTLVFLHEGLGCAALWRDFPATLSDKTGCGALVYSRFGYGGSNPCRLPRQIDFMHTEALDILPRIIEKTGVREFLLVGHSDGGSIALIFAGGVQPPGLKGVITEAAHVFCEKKTTDAIEEAKKAYDSGTLKEKLRKYHGDNTECAFRGWNDVWLHPDFMHWQIENYLPGITVPLLLIQGTDDPYGSFDQIRIIDEKTACPKEIFMVPSCGHAPHSEKTGPVLEKMAAFVRSVI